MTKQHDLPKLYFDLGELSGKRPAQPRRRGVRPQPGCYRWLLDLLVLFGTGARSRCCY